MQDVHVLTARTSSSVRDWLLYKLSAVEKLLTSNTSLCVAYPSHSGSYSSSRVSYSDLVD